MENPCLNISIVDLIAATNYEHVYKSKSLMAGKIICK